MSKDINAITACLDNYLAKTGKHSLKAVEANEILSRAGMLNDSKDRPGLPLRNLLRDGKLPHAYQTGSTWIIPHSGKPGFKIATTATSKSESSIRVIKASDLSSSDTTLLHKLLMNQKNFKSAGSIDNLVPHNSGIYCIRISEINQLPTPFNKFLEEREHNIIYIGIATESLNKRFLNQELRAKGHGTFFRSIGAVLGHRPPKGSLTNKANKRNYKFSPTDEQKIIRWINDNLQVNWIEFNGDFESFESELVNQYRPLINLAKNPSALQLLSQLRSECVQIANEI